MTINLGRTRRWAGRPGAVARAAAALTKRGRALCGAYLGDNDGTCPQLTCIRAKDHDGPHDNVRGDDTERGAT